MCRVRGGAAEFGEVEGGACSAEAVKCGGSGHYRLWLLSSISLGPEVGQDLLLFWCQQLAAKFTSPASVTGPCGTSHAAYHVNSWYLFIQVV